MIEPNVEEKSMNFTVFYEKSINRLHRDWIGVERFFKGWLFYLKFRRSKDKNTIYWYLSSLLGDSVYGMAYLKAYKDKYKDKHFVVVGNERFEDILKSYECADEIKLFKSGSKENEAYSSFMTLPLPVRIKAVKYGMVAPYPRIKIKERKPEVGALYQIRESILNLPAGTQITLPKIYPVEVTSINNFDAIHDRVVILNVYTTSIYNKTDAFYEKIVDFLKEKNCVVFSNIVGEQKPVKGTYELRCSLNELYSICNKIPLLVSVRSGILDFLAGTNVNMFINYEGAKYLWSINQMEEWRRTAKVCEIFDGKQDGAFSKFVEFYNEVF